MSAGDVGGCNVLWHGGTQAVRLGRAPIHCSWGCTVHREVAHRHRGTANTPAASSLLQVIVQTQGTTLRRILHDSHCWFAGRIPSHARQRVAIVTRHHGNVLAIVYTLRHVAVFSIFIIRYGSVNTERTAGYKRREL